MQLTLDPSFNSSYGCPAPDQRPSEIENGDEDEEDLESLMPLASQGLRLGTGWEWIQSVNANLSKAWAVEHFVPEGHYDCSQARSAWDYEENGPVPAGRLNRSWLEKPFMTSQNQVEHPGGGLFHGRTFVKRGKNGDAEAGKLWIPHSATPELLPRRMSSVSNDKLSLELTMSSTVPGWDLPASLPRHFVPVFF